MVDGSHKITGNIILPLKPYKMHVSKIGSEK